MDNQNGGVEKTMVDSTIRPAAFASPAQRAYDYSTSPESFLILHTLFEEALSLPRRVHAEVFGC
jgi:hypothetical protein